MSQIAKQNTGGGGGGITSVVGQSSLVAPTVTVTTVANVATVEDRAWQTQYVVDPDTTQGLRGTFSTIQAALDQAVLDGMAFNNQKVIYIRTGLYTEDLVIPPGTILTGVTFSYPFGGPITPTDNTHILGSHVFTGNAVCSFNNIIFQTVAGNTFDGGSSAIALLYFDNCVLVHLSDGNIIDDLAEGSYLSFSRCSFGGSNLNNINLLAGLNTLYMNGCFFSQPLGIAIAGGDFICRNTTGIGHTVLSGGSSIDALSCTWSSVEDDYVIDATDDGSGGTLRNCSLGLADVACISAIGDSGASWFIDSCVTGSSTFPAPGVALYEDGANVNSESIGTQGSIIKSFRTAVDSTILTTDYYTGVTDTSSARTILLPSQSVGNNVQKDKTYIIKDESGNAGTNNITITTSGAAELIDGAATKVINTNYGVVRVIYDGENYFTI